MEAMTPNGDGDSPGGDEPRRGAASPSADVLTSVAAQYAGIDASGPARVLLAQVLAATLKAFTDTRAVRDPLPETAPGSAEEALAVLAGLDHLRASLAAVDATWQVVAEQRIRAADRYRGLPASRQGKGVNHELGLARRISPSASSFSLASARRLSQHMPGMIDSLWDGAVAEQQASVVAAALDGASSETCARIDDMIREDPSILEGKGHKRLRSDIDELIQKLEPETSRARAERAARARHVTMTPLADGMARVTAVLRGIDAAGMMHVLAVQARSLKAAGERTSVPALEADLMVDAILHPPQPPQPEPAQLEPTQPEPTQPEPAQLEPAQLEPQGQVPTALEEQSASESGSRIDGRPPELAHSAPRLPRTTPSLDIGIVITDTALLGRDDDAECAQLEGYGTIPAHIVSDTLLGRPPGQLSPVEEEHPDEEVSAVFRRLYTSPRRGELIAMESQARAFPAGLARMIRWRDTTCRTPWCNAKIRQSDHVIPHHRGGPTSYANGQGLCVRCNLLKEHGLWVITALGLVDGEVDPNVMELSPAEPTPNKPGARRAAKATSNGQKPPPPQSPPAAWVWTSPHGAHGISTTPPMLAPRSSPTENSASDDDGSGPTGDPPTEPPEESHPASPA